MTRTIILFSTALILAADTPLAQSPQPYAGMQNRPLKALSDEQLDELKAGRGMGLALSRQISRRIGGDIWVADPGGDDGGAVLVARLPAVLETAQMADQDGEGDR